MYRIKHVVWAVCLMVLGYACSLANNAAHAGSGGGGGGTSGSSSSGSSSSGGPSCALAVAPPHIAVPVVITGTSGATTDAAIKAGPSNFCLGSGCCLSTVGPWVDVHDHGEVCSVIVGGTPYCFAVREYARSGYQDTAVGHPAIDPATGEQVQVTTTMVLSGVYASLTDFYNAWFNEIMLPPVPGPTLPSGVCYQAGPGCVVVGALSHTAYGNANTTGPGAVIQGTSTWVLYDPR
jgi:hypothetical protein